MIILKVYIENQAGGEEHDRIGDGLEERARQAGDIPAPARYVASESGIADESGSMHEDIFQGARWRIYST